MGLETVPAIAIPLAASATKLEVTEPAGLYASAVTVAAVAASASLRVTAIEPPEIAEPVTLPVAVTLPVELISVAV